MVVSALASGVTGLDCGNSCFSFSLSFPSGLAAPGGLSRPPLDFLRRPNRVSMTDFFFGLVCGLPSLALRWPFGELNQKIKVYPSY